MDDDPLVDAAELSYDEDSDLTEGTTEALQTIDGTEEEVVSESSETESENEESPDDANALNQLLYEKGHVFADSHLLARYQFVKYLSTYITPHGKIVLPLGADEGSPVICRRHAGYTLQKVEWTACRFRIKPQLPAVEVSSSKTFLHHRLSGSSVNVMTDGKTLVFTASGVYTYVLDAAKTTTDSFDMPGNPALDSTVGLWQVEDTDFIEGLIP